MDIELLGGALDGQRFSLARDDYVATSLRFTNPIPIKFYTGLCAPKIFSRVQYNRFCIKNGIVYYKFYGYAE